MNQLVTSAPEPAVIPPGSCPRCTKPLIDPDGLGWCKSCGYCKSLEDSEKTAAAASAPAPALTGLGATGSAIGQLPVWFWVTLVGIVLVVGVTFVAGRFLPLTPLDRAVLATVQMVVGLGVMFLGQFIGVIRIAPEESTLSFKDALFPFRLYALVMKRLPSTRHTVYCGAWGLAAIISAAVFIGGLEHWFTYLPKSQPNGKTNATQKKA